MVDLLGFQITRNNDKEKPAEAKQAFTVASPDDGTQTISAGGHYGQYMDMEVTAKNDIDLIKRYREIAQHPECDMAVEDIINEVIVSDERDTSVSVSLDKLAISDNIKTKIRDEFDEVMRLMNFDEKGHDIFRRWYVDGRIFYHKVIDKKNPKQGVVEVRYIDPRKIRKVRQVTKDKKPGSTLDIVKAVEDYFLYNDKGLNAGQITEGIKIADDSITYVPSGLIDQNKGHVLSHLNKAIKPVNQLRMIEDSVVIYRISRAPERRIFYIDVGNLPKIKAEQYLKDVMNRYRNKLVYDSSSGEIRDDRNHMSMLEDFWLPRREGGRGTEITTLQGGQNLGEIEDIKYFQNKLYRSLNVPISRMEAESGFSLGRASEITRDELKFTKFVQRLRKRFTPLFTDMLKAQLILKGIVTIEDWDRMKEHIQYNFLQDGHFAELKKAELMQDRINNLGSIESYIGTFYSKEWVQKNVLNMTESEMEEMTKQIAKEAGTDVDDGGIDVPDGTDGITRYPQDSTGGFISADDLEGSDGVNNKGDDNGN